MGDLRVPTRGVVVVSSHTCHVLQYLISRRIRWTAFGGTYQTRHRSSALSWKQLFFVLFVPSWNKINLCNLVMVASASCKYDAPLNNHLNGAGGDSLARQPSETANKKTSCEEEGAEEPRADFCTDR